MVLQYLIILKCAHGTLQWGPASRPSGSGSQRPALITPSQLELGVELLSHLIISYI